MLERRAWADCVEGFAFCICMGLGACLSEVLDIVDGGGILYP